MNEDRKKALQELSDLGQEIEKERILEEHRIDTWWDELTEQEREDAFYSVCKRIHQSEIKDRGTYRYALYDVFKFGTNMYSQGMDCGFMALHNAIGEGKGESEALLAKAVELVEQAFNEGFREGMNDVLRRPGGKTWYDSNSRKRLAELKGETDE